MDIEIININSVRSFQSINLASIELVVSVFFDTCVKIICPTAETIKTIFIKIVNKINKLMSVFKSIIQ